MSLAFTFNGSADPYVAGFLLAGFVIWAVCASIGRARNSRIRGDVGKK